jgi:hypothetical protein
MAEVTHETSKGTGLGYSGDDIDELYAKSALLRGKDQS